MTPISTDRTAALARLSALLQPDSEPVLTADEVSDLLDRNVIVSTWAASTAYACGDWVVPTVAAGYAYEALIDGGRTRDAEPAWPLGYGLGVDWVADGGQTWRLVLAPPATLWDIRMAAVEGWEMKAAKCAGEFDYKAGGVSGMRSLKYLACTAQAKRLRCARVG